MEKLQKTPIRVVISLDVEEEGLFSGQYAAQGCTVRNVELLPRLLPLSQELGFPLTLLCAHTVLTNAAACKTLALMRDHGGAEIGAHLHHWSTPPLSITDSPNAQGPQRSDKMDQDLLRQRLRTLLRAGQDFQGAPLTSFRMGRWDLKSCVRPLLAEEGILVDSSVAPLRCFAGGPDHFLAPVDPYWVETSAASPLLEVPISQVSWLPLLAQGWYALGRALPAALFRSTPQCTEGMEEKRAKFIDIFKYFGALSANPVWHGAQVMRMATRLHIARGGKVISLFWHSSEMLPGASPNIPDQAAANALLRRVREYLVWLQAHYTVQGVTLSSLHADPLASSFPLVSHVHRQNTGDW